MRALYAWRTLALDPPLMAKLKEVSGEDMMLHLCLTGWISTKREWHQDDYLNPRPAKRLPHRQGT